MRKTALALILLLASACSGAIRQGGPERPVPIGAGQVVIVFSQAPDQLPFDPRASRLVAATDQLTAIAGHPIQLGFDAALLPQFRSTFEAALIAAIENVARDLDALQKQRPGAFSYGAPRLKRVECHYDAVARYAAAKLDGDAGVIKVSMPADAQTLIERGLVSSALEDDYNGYLDRRFANAVPEQVAASDQALYFEHLSRYRRGRRSVDLGTPEGMASDPRAVQIERVARLALKVPPSNTALVESTRKFLIHEGDYFVRAYLNQPAIVQAAPADTAFHRAEAAWVRWLNASFDKLPDKQQAEVVRTPLFVRPYNRDLQPGSPRYVDFAFPGLDLYGLSLKVIDGWIRAGHPDRIGGNRERQDLFDFIVCPYERDERNNRSIGPRCEHDFYRFALDGDARKKRFVAEILARKDIAFTEMAFVNLVRSSEGVPDLLFVWRGLEADPKLWSVATHVIVEEFAEVGNKDMLHDEALRIWRSSPERRGAALYLLTAVDRYGHGAVNWKEFDRTFGAKISGPDLANLFDQGYRAISNAHVLWEGLDRGFSRADILIPRLDRYIEDPLVRVYNFRDPELAISSIILGICAEREAADVAKLHDYFTRRVAQHPSEEKRFANIIELTTKGRCISDRGQKPSKLTPRGGPPSLPVPETIDDAPPPPPPPPLPPGAQPSGGIMSGGTPKGHLGF